MNKKQASVVCLLTSLLMLLLPIAFDILYSLVSEHSRLTFTLLGKLIFLYSSVILVGVILSLHMFSFLTCSLKKWVPLLLGVLLAAETVLFHIGRFYGSLLSCFFLVIVLAEVFLQKMLARNGE